MRERKTRATPVGLVDVGGPGAFGARELANVSYAIKYRMSVGSKLDILRGGLRLILTSVFDPTRTFVVDILRM